MNYEQYILPELLILIPVLYLIGTALKRFEGIKNNWIPVILGVAGVGMALLYELTVMPFSISAVYMAIIQGILCAGATVYAHQTIKQLSKGV